MLRGISTATTVRRAAAIVIAGAAATALSACSAGLVTQTDTKQTAIDGVNAGEGDIALRDLQIEFGGPEGYEAGDDAPLRVWIANDGADEVRLVGVETEAGTVTLVSAAAEETPSEAPTTPGEDEAAADGESTADEDGADEEGTDEDAAEETSTPAEDATTEADTLQGETAIDIPIAPFGHVRLDQDAEDRDYLLLENLGQAVLTGQTVAVTFMFSDGTEVSVDLPVGAPADPPDREFFEPEEAEGGH